MKFFPTSRQNSGSSVRQGTVCGWGIQWHRTCPAYKTLELGPVFQAGQRPTILHLPRWWFQTFLIFIPTWGRLPF